MKISLLLDREPFGEILEETLSRHLSAVSDRAHQVIWKSGAPKASDVLARKRGLWLCNPEINAIFSVSAESRVFEVPWREYLAGASFVRTGAHAGYLMAASAPIGRWVLASHHLLIDPELTGAKSTLIVGGNSRVRLLDYDRGLAKTILKSRVDPAAMQRELDLRRDRTDILAPPIVEVQENGLAFVEPLIHGTNADRVFSDRQADKGLIEALEVCFQLGRQTRRVELVDEWLDRTLEECRQTVETANDARAESFRGALDLVYQLAECIRTNAGASSNEVEVGTSHGDLQRGNVLLEGEKTWLIDWEKVGSRILGYDGLTLALDSRRSGRGLVERAKRLLQDERTDAIAMRVGEELSRDLYPGGRVRHMLMFFVEEIRFHLEENVMIPSSGCSPSLSDLVTELEMVQGDDFWNVG